MYLLKFPFDSKGSVNSIFITGNYRFDYCVYGCAVKYENAIL